MRPQYDIAAFAEQCAQTAGLFQDQDVFYGRYTVYEIGAQILEAEGINGKEQAKLFLTQHGILDEQGKIIPQRALEYLATKSDSVTVEDGDTSYRTINFGKVYDEETGEFWANAELLQKHKDFIATGKTSTQGQF